MQHLSRNNRVIQHCHVQEYTPTSQPPTVTQQLPLFPPPPSSLPQLTVTGPSAVSSASLPVTSSLPLNVSSVLTRPIALSQIASSLPTTANSTDLAQLFNQFLRQATGQSMPQALSPASIDGNQQTQPTTALQPAHNLQLPQKTISVQPAVQQPITALQQPAVQQPATALQQPATVINNQQFPQQTAPIQPQPIPAQPLLYQ